ncbi:MAG: T9SS type A sorting domain-containing protein [Rhodothermaceae bacterium]|nr:T9SS type A sorting domain-containing protein [Rhodothermaceae bacterium]MYF41153.1 T9SS type A sorting domain-containing protein [Rhodothermaceae bacterium]
MRGARTSIQRDPVEIPNGFTLSQNYPNPFNPQTKIEFEMKDGGFAKLKVYDVLGREVATLVDEHLAAGKYTATFNAANTLASGTYVYQLEVAGHRLSGKMMLVK